MRPIEYLGWFKSRLDNCEMFYKNNNLRVFVKNNGDINLSTAESYPNEELSFKELEAIYETAKEIKAEKEMEDKILCNKCANDCWYGFISCSNFKPKENS